MRRRMWLSGCIRLVVFCLFARGGIAQAQGLMTPGVGPINRSMGGAAVAAPADGLGALFFNPATLSAFESNELVIGADIPLSREEVFSYIPGVGSGQTTADIGVFPLMATSVVYLPEGIPELRYAMGIFTAGGLFSNFPGDPSNPVLGPPPPNGFGIGPVFSLLNLTQFIPAASYQATEQFSIGFSPIVTVAALQLDPVTLVPPDDADGDGFFRYPSATGTHPHYGLGFQAGAFWKSETGWQAGFSYKSKNWFETIKINSQDEIGAPRQLSFKFALPPVYSLGLAYAGVPDWLFAADVRYMDYDSVPILSDAGFRPDGSLRGVGWESVFSLSLGVSRRLNDALTVRGGWFVTENPIPDAQASANVGTPAFYTNLLSLGASVRFNEMVTWNFAYYYSLPSDIRGPLVTPGGVVPDAFVENRFDAHAVVVSLQMNF